MKAGNIAAGINVKISFARSDIFTREDIAISEPRMINVPVIRHAKMIQK